MHYNTLRWSEILRDTLKCSDMLRGAPRSSKVCFDPSEMSWHALRGHSNAVRFSEILWVAFWRYWTLTDTLGSYERIWDALKGHWVALRCFEILWGMLRCLWDAVTCSKRALRCCEILWESLSSPVMVWDTLRHSRILWMDLRCSQRPLRCS